MLAAPKGSTEQAKMVKLSQVQSYWRVLNLHDIKKKRGRSGGEGIPENAAFFRSENLSNAIFTKHLVREHERSHFKERVFSATKVISPMNGDSFADGAFVFFLEEPNVEQHLKSRYGIDRVNKDGERDMEILTLLSQTPTLDLFILCELIDFSYYGISNLYVAESKLANSEMRQFITNEMKPLVSLAVGVVSTDQLNRFVESIFGPEIKPQAMQFLSLIGIPDDIFNRVIFSWKAQLYYEHSHTDLLRRAIATVKWLDGVTIHRYDEQSPLSTVEFQWGKLRRYFKTLTQNCQHHMKAMDRSKREQFLKTADIDGLRDYLLDMQFRVGQYANGFSVLEQLMGVLTAKRKAAPDRLEAADAFVIASMANGIVDQYADYLN